MKRSLLLLFLFTAFIFVGCSDDDKATVVVSFEGKLTEANSEFATKSEEKTDDGYYVIDTFKDPSNALEFNHFFGQWGLAGGFTYCNYTDIETPGSENFSAITGKGVKGSTYLTANIGRLTKITMLKTEAYKFKGAWVTNNTFAYLAIKNGEGSFFDDSKFEDGDWFLLTATGYDAEDKKIGAVEHYLADFRNGKTKITNTWEWVDFRPISNAIYIVFTMKSSDENQWGMKTPGYFCMDGITLEEK